MGNTSWNEPTPIQLGTASDWQKVVSGVANTFAIKNNGTLWGSGDNLYGGLGIGSTAINSNVFLQIGTATNWSKIAAAQFFTIALRTDGTIWGWGQNDFFQVIGGTVANQLIPVQIGTANDWVDVETTSVRTSFGLKSNGTVWGWGSNSGMLLGSSAVSSLSTPTQLNTATDWSKLAAGAVHILALKTNGTLWAWGAGDYGQLGNNATNSSFNPIQIGTDTWSYIAAGTSTSYGIKSNGTLWSWGRNNNGQLGHGTTTDLLVPTQIGTDTDWATIDTNHFNFRVATKTDGTVWVWGFNTHGEFGNGTVNVSSNVPLQNTAICTTLEIESLTKVDWQVYPNPASNQVQISYDTNSEATIEIYDLQGKLLKTMQTVGLQGTVSIPLTNLSRGLYLVKFATNDGVIQMEKLVVE